MGAAALAMVKQDDVVDLNKFAMPIADKIIEGASVAHNGKGDFRAD